MPLDGVSSSNSEFYKLISPLDINIQAEQNAKTQAETIIKKVDQSDNIDSEEEENEDGRKRDLQGRDTEENEDEDSKSNIINNYEKIKKYKVKLNQITDMVELIDLKTGLIIETISPDDLINLISKTQKYSGFLVDKEV